MTTNEPIERNASTEEQTFPRRDFPLVCKCLNKFRLQTSDATGFIYNACGSGPVIMSNVFLSTSLILLAKMDLGCDLDRDESVEGECVGKVYGFKPSSLITLIATLTGILACFLLPFLGAIIDYTKYRHALGVGSSTILVVIQAIQIGTVQATWFPMAILQAINGFMYQVVTLCQYSYLPEIEKQVDTKTMTWYTSLFYMVQFGHQAMFVVLIFVICVKLLKLNEVQTAQFSQGADVMITGFYYFLSWYFFTQKEPKNQLRDGEKLATAGFKQVYRTSKGLYKHYPSTVFLYFVGVLFLESAINSFTTVSITFMTEVVKLSGNKIAFVFLVTLIATIPGSMFGNWLSNKTNPMTGVKINIVIFNIVNLVGFLNINGPEDELLMFTFGVFWGILLGWYYPLEKLIFSMIVPSGQESELAGFFLYCTQILSWLPPLVFTLMNEVGINLSWGGVHLNVYLLSGLICLMFMPKWQICLDRARGENKMKQQQQKYTNVQMGGMVE